MEGSSQPIASGSLQRLLGYLSADPGNLQLMADAAGAALDEGELDHALELLERYETLEPLTPTLKNLRGLVALAQQRFADAAETFQTLVDDGQSNPEVRFNLAWCRAMLCDYDAALAQLDDRTTTALPQAAALKIQAMHHLGQLDEALVAGLAMSKQHPSDTALMGALSLVAVDAKQAALAYEFASRAGDRHEGLSTLGTLALDENDVDVALGLFDRALEAYSDSARALLGKGLGLMAKGQAAEAAPWLERSAVAFGDHLGSWIAAGWAHFVAGDVAEARGLFERALAIDANFAETHGALAVIDIVEGKLAEAEKRAEIALRLDRHCFSAALAKSMLLSARGEEQSARRVRELALAAVISPDGRTLGQAIAGLAAMRGR